MQKLSESEFLIEVGKRLTFFRKERGLSQEYVASNAGITQCYLSDAERGKRNITLKVVYGLTSVLDIDPAMLFDFSTETFRTEDMTEESGIKSKPS